MNKTEEEKRLENKILELEQTIRVLKEDLIHDSLTGLKTRKFFKEEALIYFNSAMERFKLKRKEWFNFRNISFVFFDIDHFKKVNDTHGHLVGDEILKSVASCIQGGIRKGDIAARWGGEEIVVALVGSNEKNARVKAESIRKKVERLSFNSIPGVNVTISGGVASAMPDTTFEEVLVRADKALYKAKETGRNKIIAWSEV